MKNLFFAAIPVLFLALTFCSCENATDNSGLTPVQFKVYEKYYYQGPDPQGDMTLFYWTRGRSAFSSLFIYLSDVLPVDTIPKADLDSLETVSIVKYGNDMYDLGIALVYLKGDTLQVEYTATLLKENMTFTVALPIIVMVDASFKYIKFYENGTPVKGMAWQRQ